MHFKHTKMKFSFIPKRKIIHLKISMKRGVIYHE